MILAVVGTIVLLSTLLVAVLTRLSRTKNPVGSNPVVVASSPAVEVATNAVVVIVSKPIVDPEVVLFEKDVIKSKSEATNCADGETASNSTKTPSSAGSDVNIEFDSFF